jgi:hypothetical protein
MGIGAARHAGHDMGTTDSGVRTWALMLHDKWARQVGTTSGHDMGTTDPYHDADEPCELASFR